VILIKNTNEGNDYYIIRHTDKHIIEKLSEENFVDLYQEKIVSSFLVNHKNINIFLMPRI
jgi:hypothetical protein